MRRQEIIDDLENLKLQIKNNSKQNTYSKTNDSFFSNRNLKLEITKKVANSEINVLTASNYLHIDLIDYFVYLIDIEDAELKNKLKPIVSLYGIFINEESEKSLMNNPIEVQKEIVLMALTYRVSYKMIAEMFKVSLKDVIKTFKTFDNLALSLDTYF